MDNNLGQRDDEAWIDGWRTENTTPQARQGRYGRLIATLPAKTPKIPRSNALERGTSRRDYYCWFHLVHLYGLLIIGFLRCSIGLERRRS
jgi:hypothetical protein